MMHHNRKPILAVLLTAVLLLPLFGCGAEQNPSPAETQAAGTVPVQSETEPAETGPKRDVADVPEGTSFDGYEFVSYSREIQFSNTAYSMFLPDEETGEILNDTVFRRNAAVQDKYNVKLTRDSSAGKGQGAAVKAAAALILAQEDFADIIIDQTVKVAQNIANGYFCNLAKVPNLNPSKNYWDQDFLADMTVVGKQYMLTGDIMYNDEDALMMCMFNSEMSKDYQIDDLYSLAREGKWTLDVMEENMKKVIRDVNGDGEYTLTDDSVGLLYIYNCFIEPFLAASGTHIVTHDKDGKAMLAETAPIFDVYQRISELINKKGYAGDWRTLPDQIPGITAMFEQKRVLFQLAAISLCRRFYRDFTVDFGMLPVPKTEPDQPYYATSLNTNLFEAIVVPITKKDAKNTGMILELLAWHSEDLTPTFYETCFQSKYTRDKESYEMLALARQHIFYDMGYYYDFGNLVADMRTGAMANSPIASLWESGKPVAQAAIDELNAFKDN